MSKLISFFDWVELEKPEFKRICAILNGPTLSRAEMNSVSVGIEIVQKWYYETSDTLDWLSVADTFSKEPKRLRIASLAVLATFESLKEPAAY